MNSNAFLRAIVVIFSVYAVAAVSVLVFYVGDPGPVITPLTATFGMLITALMAKQLSDSNVIQQATAAKVETVVVAQETLAKVAVAAAQETTAISAKADETHELMNGAKHQAEALALEIAGLRTRLAAVLAHQAGEKDGIGIGRAQAETEAALLAQQPPEQL